MTAAMGDLVLEKNSRLHLVLNSSRIGPSQAGTVPGSFRNCEIANF